MRAEGAARSAAGTEGRPSAVFTADHRVCVIPKWFWARARSMPRLLMLDYDGVLAPAAADLIRTARGERSLQTQSLSMLRWIASGPSTTLAIISARPIDQILPRIRSLPAWFVGENGWEVRSPEDDIIFQALDEPARLALEEAALRTAGFEWASRVELIRTSVTLVTRGLHPREARDITLACERAWRPLASACGLRLSCIDGGLELRAPGYDTSAAIHDLIQLAEPGALPVYLGGESAAEDAFEVVSDAGLGILVGGAERHSLAAGRLGSQCDVATFLEMWLGRLETCAAVGGDREGHVGIWG